MSPRDGRRTATAMADECDRVEQKTLTKSLRLKTG